MAYRNYANSVGFIVDKNGLGDFTTISSAISAATSGTNIFIRPGTYTENLTLVAGVNLIAFSSSNAIIIGKCSMSVIGSVLISGLTLETNNDYALEVSASVASKVTVENCFFNCTNHTGINYSSSSSSSSLTINSSTADLGTTGIALLTSSSAGSLNLINVTGTTTGSSTTASNISAGITDLKFCEFSFPFSTSSTGLIEGQYTIINCTNSNAVALQIGSNEQNNFQHSHFLGGTAQGVTIAAASVVTLAQTLIYSTNTNAIDGTGTLNAGVITFSGSSSTINAGLTVNKLTTYGGTIV